MDGIAGIAWRDFASQGAPEPGAGAASADLTPASTARKGAASAYTVEPTYFYTYLLSTSTGNVVPVTYQAIGYLTRMDARIELTGLLGCSEAGTFVPFAGYYADRYNCPLYNGIIAVAWTPSATYTPWIWYYFLTP